MRIATALLLLLLVVLFALSSARNTKSLQQVFKKSALARRTTTTSTSTINAENKAKLGPWNPKKANKAWVIGFPGDTDLKGIITPVWYELASKGHQMIAEGPISDIIAGTHKAYGFHPQENFLGRVWNMNNLWLVMPNFVGSYVRGAVQDDSHWIKRTASTPEEWYWKKLAPKIGWLLCQKEVDCDAKCEARIADDLADPTNGGYWLYSFPGNSCSKKGTSLWDENFDNLLDEAKEKQKYRGDKKYYCFNCIYWIHLAGIREPGDSKGKVKQWMHLAQDDGFDCGCYVWSKENNQLEKKAKDDDLCKDRFKSYLK